MALVIPEFLPTKTYPFARLRDLVEEMPIQEGVIGANDMLVVQRAAGVNRSVDVGVGAAYLKGDDVARQGTYKHYNDGTINVAASTNTSGNPRVDQLILQNKDSSVLGSSDVPEYQILAGTPAAATQVLDPSAANYRAGAAALPASALRLAEWVAANGYTQIVNADIQDRRGWGRGAYRRITRTANAGGTNDYQLTGTSFVSLDATNVRPEIECSGAPVKMTFTGKLSHGSLGHHVILIPWIDGVAADSLTTGDWFGWIREGSNQDRIPVTWEWTFVPPAGLHRFEWAWRTTAASAAIYARVTDPMQVTVQELVRQNAANG